MGLRSLRLESSNLDALIAEELAALQIGVLDPERVLRLCRYERQRGCAALLLSLDSKDFRDHLSKAGIAYLYLLERRDALNPVDPYYLARSAGVPYLDALASGDRALAIEIAVKSTPVWTPDMEDEDDFFYFISLAALDAMPPNSVEIDGALSEFGRSLNGATSARLDALRAIQQRNETMFDLALKAILANWEKHVEERRTSGIADPYFVNVEAPVCIEALALVQVARIHRVPTQRSYPYLSQLALDLPTVSGRPDLWEDLV